MTDTVDCVVAGAGVVGLAAARQLALGGREVLVIEAETMIGSGISSRNSEVVHAGIYYPPGSLKARLCLDGRERLYRYMDEHGVPHRRCGKLIVSTSAEQDAALSAIAANARENGVHDLVKIAGAEAMAMEPGLRCTAALLSPSTGIVDSHGLMLALLGDAEDHGAAIAFNTEIVGGRIEPGRIVLETRDRLSGETFEMAARAFVNAAGLGATGIAAALSGFPSEKVPPLHYAKGNYFSVTGRTPFTRLIYPVPEPGGLGVHLTLDLDGIARFGPDVEWTDTLDYRVDPARADRFYGAIRSYWPALADGSLQPAYSGIRPKLGPAGAPAADFVVQGPADHGVAGLVNLFGIESPGLTSCLAIAGLAADRLDG